MPVSCSVVRFLAVAVVAFSRTLASGGSPGLHDTRLMTHRALMHIELRRLRPH